MKKPLPLLLGLLLIPTVCFAQAAGGTASSGTAPASGQKTVEEKRLQSSVAVQVISSLIQENGRAEKFKALEYIRNMVDKGSVTEGNTEVISLIEELGSEGTTKQVVEKGRVVNDYPDIRREAAELLGQIGGKQAREVLINMMVKDKEPMVISEAIYSLGLIGGAEQQARIESILVGILKTQNVVRPDANLAFAAVSALEMFGKKNNGKVNQEVLVVLINISEGNYIRPVKEKAKQVLDGFTKY